MRYNNVNYYFVKDLFGNVYQVLHQDGTMVAEYEYDAWGNCEITYNSINLNDLSKNIMADKNPFRYRGYYMDSETGYYYLQSRYYDPALRRFLSSDSYDLIPALAESGDLNLYAYCSNNPVMFVDPSGEFALTTFGIWAIVGIVTAAMVMGGGVQLVSNALAGETGSDLWQGVAGSALGSGANALALCLVPLTGGASLAVSALIGAGVQTGVDTIETLIRGEDVALDQTILDFGINFVTTFTGNWLGSKIIPTNSGWFKPQHFMSVFTKPYGQKILLQTAIGAGLSGTVNFVRKIDVRRFLPAVPVPLPVLL